MLNDQEHILEQVMSAVRSEKPQAILIAGDVYDKQIPSIEALRLFDRFLTELAAERVAVLLISGNHDSPERLGFAGRIISDSGIYLQGVFEGRPGLVTLRDQHGEVDFYLLPFIRPSSVRSFHAAALISSYQDAWRTVWESVSFRPQRRRVLLAHQFVVAAGEDPERSESEIGPVGGLDSVSVEEVKDFHYVALGHLHGPQRIGYDWVRYAGSPLKYSFSEHRQHKSLTVVEMDAQGGVDIRFLPLKPLHDLRIIRGPLAELLSPQVVASSDREDYLRVVLTDEEEIIDPIGKLRSVYPNVMELKFDNSRSNADIELSALPQVEGISRWNCSAIFSGSRMAAP